MTTKQITVLTANGALPISRVISRLSRAAIDLRAHCLVDNGDGHCKLRMVVSDPDGAVAGLKAEKIAAVVNDVVMVETDDKPGALSRMLEMFADDELQIEYSYTAASALPGVVVMVFRFSDNARAAAILRQNGVAVL